ncbi:diguanylate cyclase [Clostridium cellulovorans]|uniref:Diguanylate cyclase with TPR repeats n=1 Tax=Clostridium cellulovorans (strain ATCC 35296 / DSM 3052 / OCM 3 / 743B) TaxID=573061 RepID=D9SS51_CLOC7|nr:diguanylate cyclase [Clostridium cellulovorans]ADL52498.1 diguanylate cyclase with TPR repeats [Clostridium cellulovorans 743B]
MELINDNYKLEEKLYENTDIEVFRIMDNNLCKKQAYLHILKENKSYKNDIEHLNHVGQYIFELNIDGTIEFENTVVIYNIDGKRLSNKMFGYITAVYDLDMDFEKEIQQLKTAEKCEMFLKICSVINTLHLKGFIYGSIHPRNIVKDDNNEFKLKDLATIELEKNNFWERSVKDDIYNAPELFRTKEYTASTDIFSLGMLFFTMFKKEINEKSFENYKDISLIITKMIQDNPKKRYKHVTQIIKDFNKALNTKVQAFNIEDLEKLTYNSEFIGRDYELKQIFSHFEEMKKKQSKFNVFTITGQVGIGKTKMCQELYNKFLLEDAETYFVQLSNKSDYDKALPRIMEDMISVAPKNLVYKYYDDIRNLLSEEYFELLKLPSKHEEYKLISRIANFICEFAKTKPMVVIIDNIQYLSRFILKVIEFLSVVNSNTENILCIFSYGELQDNECENLRFLVDRMKKTPEYHEIKLTPLNEMETINLVRKLLYLPENTIKFPQKMYKETLGNPLFIKEAIRNLVLNKTIYINEATGQWYNKYSDVNEIPIPPNVKQAIEVQIQSLNLEEEGLLENLCIFDSAVDINTLSKVENATKMHIYKHIENLIARGILVEKIGDLGYLFDFSNKMFKKIIYYRMELGIRERKHKLAATIIEEKVFNGENNCLEELIYHLEMANEKEKAIEYCIKTANKFQEIYLYDSAIDFMNKAIKLEKKTTRKKMELYSQIAYLYNLKGEIQTSLSNYEKARKIARTLKDKIREVDMILFIGDLYNANVDIEKLEEHVDMAKSILKGISYQEGNIKTLLLEAYIAIIKEEYQLSLELSIKGLNLCQEKNIALKARFYLNIGSYHYLTGDGQKAIECYKISYDYAKVDDNPKGQIFALNNIAVVHQDIFQDNIIALDNLMEIKKLSEKYNLQDIEILSYLNIGITYYNEYLYKEAEYYLKMAIEKAEFCNYTTYIYSGYLSLTELYTSTGDVENAYYYYQLIKQFLTKYPYQGNSTLDYYWAIAYNSFFTGNIQRAKKYFNLNYKSFFDKKNLRGINCRLYLSRIEIHEDHTEQNIEKYIEELRDMLSEVISDEFKLVKCYEARTFLDIYGKGQLIDDFSSEINLDSLLNSEKINIRIVSNYFKSLLVSDNKEKIKYLNNCVNLRFNGNAKNIEWKVYNDIGNCLKNDNDYINAINYYLEACDKIKDMILALPVSYRSDFINFNKLMKPFNNLIAILLEIEANIEPLSDIKEIKSEEDIEKLIKITNFREIVNNEKFFTLVQKNFDQENHNTIVDIEAIIKNLNSDPLVSLDIIIKYLVRTTLSSEGYILSEQLEGNNKVMASFNGSISYSFHNYILEKVRAEEKPILVTVNDVENLKIREGLLPNSAKAVMCIPIYSDKKANKTESDIERRNKQNEPLIIGYILLVSNKLINKFDSESLERALDIIPLVTFIIEKHQLAMIASIDKLTKAYTRKALESYMIQQLEHSKNNDEEFSLIIFDVDKFKDINDTFGHQTGDLVLSSICKVILSSIRKHDICGRYGGEEFIVLLPNTSTNEALEIAERLRIKVEEAKILGDRRDVTISLGISSYPIHGSDISKLVKRADQALYMAKETGRNKSFLWEAALSKHANVTNKLTGIITSDAQANFKRVSTMIEISELIKDDKLLRDKIYDILGKIIGMTNSEEGTLIVKKDLNSNEIYSRKRLESGFITTRNFNYSVINSVIDNGKALTMVDWENYTELNASSDIPNWNSIAVCPLIRQAQVIGVLYLTVPMKEKEFGFEELNYLSTLAQIVAGII